MTSHGPDPKLTHQEAIDRAALVAVDRYRIELDLTGGDDAEEKTFRSNTTVHFRRLESDRHDSEIFVDIIAKTIRTATLNGHDIAVSGHEESGRITLTELDAENELVVDADYFYSDSSQGLYRWPETKQGPFYLYTQLENADARRLFACFDQPDLKAEFEVIVTAPAHWRVISNGVAQEPKDVDGAKVHAFAATERMSTYLVAVFAGPYVCAEDNTYTDMYGETIPMRIFCRESREDKLVADEIFAFTKHGFRLFENKFGHPYPFKKYDQIYVPGFLWSGMENAAAVTLTERHIFLSDVVTRADRSDRAEVVLHELAHMWFGDLVTMKWWGDLWLNEAFATWAAYWSLAKLDEFSDAWTTFAIKEKAKAYKRDQQPSTHPVIDEVNDLDDVNENFDDITYRKGASALKQLVLYLGETTFFKGLQAYFQAHKFGSAEFGDLLAALRDASGEDLSGWAEQWLRTTGINTLSADFDLSADGEFTRFAITQSRAKPGDGEERKHRVHVGIYDDDDGKLIRKHVERVDVSGPSTPVPALHGVSRGKLILVNDDDWSYCALRLDPESWQTVLNRIRDIAGSLPRALAWATAWDMTRDAELKARDWMSLVLSAIDAETGLVVQQLMTQLQTALGSYAEPGWANGTGWPGFADRLLQLAGRAEERSAQLAYVNALCKSVLSPSHTAVLSALLESGDPAKQGLPGLQVDFDLRWRIVIALATAGVIDADGRETPVIDAEEKRHTTATADAASRYAKQARASRPQAAAKEAAWQQVVDLMNSDESTKDLSLDIIAGFVAPGQSDLLSPYTARYFTTIKTIWKPNDELVKQVATNLYPRWDVNDVGIRAAEAFLASQADGSLKNIVRDGQGDVIRALAARNFDASN